MTTPPTPTPRAALDAIPTYKPGRPPQAREGMTFHLVDSVDQALELALEEPIPHARNIRASLLRATN